VSSEGGLFGVVEKAPIAWLPERYRAPMRAYLGQGVAPAAPLRQLLEHDVAGAMPASLDGAAMLERLQVFRWINDHLPAACYGCRDQVNLWIVYVRRARGRALLAMMERSADADATPEASPQPTRLRHPARARPRDRDALRSVDVGRRRNR
jgi:hypothetical protein